MADDNDGKHAGATPLVSVAMPTYNHERFIAQAIDSVLMQQTSFPIELVIADDCSTDRTRDIVLRYAAAHRQVIRPILPELNTGMQRNAAAVLAGCNGRYVAILEGDDYWTSGLKLQRQVELLESHPEYSMCFAAHVDFTDGTSESSELFPPLRKSVYTLGDILQGNFIGTCTTMFRRSFFHRPSWVNTLPAGDWPRAVLCAMRGPIGYIDEIVGALRRHAGGAWSARGLIRNYEGDIEILRAFRAHFGSEYRPVIDKGIALRHDLIGDQWLAQHRRVKALAAYARSVFVPGGTRAVGRRRLLASAVACVPGARLLAAPARRWITANRGRTDAP